MEGRHRRRRLRRSSSAAVGRKVRELRRLVPGGEAVPADRLLLRTADYIVRLRARVQLLRALSELLAVAHGGHGAAVDEAELAS
ncbi:hypothetical protein ACP70R_006492 [Stipagrostis hirtigluma subsp. patula]